MKIRPVEQKLVVWGEGGSKVLAEQSILLTI